SLRLPEPSDIHDGIFLAVSAEKSLRWERIIPCPFLKRPLEVVSYRGSEGSLATHRTSVRD
ncbi:MAG: hypothetical protein KAJ09_13780, partial [Deltaproteobacteria bacterium]|nr:hypothetical protein [Deltaproteobacteria bacterium]